LTNLVQSFVTDLPVEYNIVSELLLDDPDVTVMSEIFCCFNFANCCLKYTNCKK